MRPGMKPGMKPGGKKNKNRPKIQRLKTVWITTPTPPFKNDYQVGQQIGEPGQFGKAYRCKRKKDKKIFAVKCIAKARFYRLDRSAQRRQALLIAMQGEIDIMRRLKHKYIVNMEECYEDKHTLYIVMEECKGGELFDRIRDRQRYKEKDASPIIKMVLEALFYMHEYHRVVHCDLKPDNILFVNKTEKSPIKIIDFGMSKVLPRLRSLRELCGTPYYTAPEIIKGDYAHGCDMWSIGVIMFVMLFGFPPFYVDPNKYYGQREAQAIYRLIQKGFDPKLKRGYGPWFPKKMPVSDEARDLMAKLMEADTAKRFSAKEALQTPWIINAGKSAKELLKEKKLLLKNQKKNKKKLLAANKPVANTATATATTAATTATTATVATTNTAAPNANAATTASTAATNNNAAPNANANANPNDDNKMNLPSMDNTPSAVTKEIGYQFANFATSNQFKHAITTLFRDQYKSMRPAHFQNLKKLFKDLDKDGNGTIDYDEFKEGMLKSPDLNLQIADIDKMFKELDVNKIGQIDFDALVNAAVHDYLIASDQRLYEAFRELDDDEDGKIKTEQLKQKIKQLGTYGKVDELLKIVDAVDLDKDGTIDYEEFLRALHPDFNETPKWFWGAQTQFDDHKDNN